MGRLLDWPRDHRINSMEPLTGPRASGAGSTESRTGFVQTTSSPFGLWRWQFGFTPIKGEALRRHRGLVTALHGGANAVRVPFNDPDLMSWQEMGLSGSDAEHWQGVPWSNNLPWGNGLNWGVAPPIVAVQEAAPAGGTVIRLAFQFWGHRLGTGDMFGFLPFHFGLYTVTEVISPGRYRIWPPLRRPTEIWMSATLRPIMAMRLEGESGANLPRNTRLAEGLTMTLIEVEHFDVNDYFAD